MKTPPALRLAYTGFALIGIAVVAAFIYSRVQPTPLTPLTPPTESAVGARAVPATQPEFTLSGLDGKRHPISEWSGHPQIVNFWATWCVPCRKEIPLLNRIQAEYAGKGVKIIGIAVDFPDDVQKFIKDTPLAYDVLMGEEDALEAAKAYGVDNMALPFSAFIDSHGRILTVHLGELHEPNLRATLDVLLQFDANGIDASKAPAAIDALTQHYTTSEAPNH